MKLLLLGCRGGEVVGVGYFSDEVGWAESTAGARSCQVFPAEFGADCVDNEGMGEQVVVETLHGRASGVLIGELVIPFGIRRSEFRAPAYFDAASGCVRAGIVHEMAPPDMEPALVGDDLPNNFDVRYPLLCS